MIEEIKVRGEILRFAFAMENVLQQNDQKGGWSNCALAYLSKRLGDEYGELRRALKTKTPEKIKKEAVDVANFAMMIFDNAEDLS